MRYSITHDKDTDKHHGTRVVITMISIDDPMTFRANLNDMSEHELEMLAVEMTGTVLGDFVCDELATRARRAAVTA